MLLEQEFTALEHVSTIAAISSDITIEQIKRNIKRSYKRLHDLPEFKKLKSEPIALVGGGPSLDSQLDKLREFKNIIVCGSAHDYLVDKNVIPTYATVCDPDAISARYLTRPNRLIKYLVATGCHDQVYDNLQGYEVFMWHCHSDDYMQTKIESDFQAIGGGCTVGLRSLSIAIMLGYSDIHFFGFDSCLGTDSKHHAYDFTDETQEELGKIYKVCLGYDNKANKGKIFYCAGYQLAQLVHFKDFYAKYNSMFEPTFHGEGLLPEAMRIINDERKRLYIEKGTTLSAEIQKNRAARLEKLQGALNTPKGQAL